MQNTSYTKKQFALGFIKMVVSVVAFAIVAFCVNAVFQPKYTQETTTDTPSTTIIRGFYDLDKNAIDAVFIGSSVCYYGINPLVIWHETGIRSHSFGSPNQRLDTSVFFMEEMFKTQKPKVVMVDAGRFVSGASISEARFRKAMDEIPLSLEKLQYINDRIQADENLLHYAFAGIRYHDRWPDLKAHDFTIPLIADRHDFYHGYAPISTTSSLRMNAYEDAVEDAEISDENVAYMKRMKEICAKNGAELVFIKVPSSTWRKAQSELVAELAQREGLRY